MSDVQVLPVNDRDAAVVSVDVEASGEALLIKLADGRKLEAAAKLLWEQCPSASGRRRRLDGRALAPCNLRITAVAPVGHYAINVAFSDGHDRGIYPWTWLVAIASRPTFRDFMMPR